MKYKYEPAELKVNHPAIQYYQCEKCIANTFFSNVVFKTIDGNICKNCIKNLENTEPDYAIGLGVWGSPT